MPEAKTTTFIDEICAIPGGEDIKVCIQCGTCTASCPTADRMDCSPSHLIAMARAGMREEVLSANSMWLCLSCYLCVVRCPRDIKITRLMHVLESLSARSRLSNKRTTTPRMYKGFNKFIIRGGRISELWMMVGYYLRTNPLKALGMLPIAVSLFLHKRISLKIDKMKPEGIKQLNAIIDKAESSGGTW
ncbi:MAG: 4Fe-4S dicluster domain-containing protein [Dehalococcoidales bacterium]